MVPTNFGARADCAQQHRKLNEEKPFVSLLGLTRWANSYQKVGTTATPVLSLN
jgi:hypothetical protein